MDYSWMFMNIHENAWIHEYHLAGVIFAMDADFENFQIS